MMTCMPHVRKCNTALMLALLLVGVMATTGHAQLTGMSVTGATPAFDAVAWSTALTAERARDDSVLSHSPLSPFAAIGQRVMDAGKPLRVVLPADTLLLGHPTADPGLPQLEFLWRKAEGAAYVRSPHGGDFRLNRKAIGPVPQAVTSADTVFAERFLLKVYASETSARVRAFAPGGAGQNAYHGLNHFKPDPAYRVTARLLTADESIVIMPTSAGLEKAYIRHSRVEFEINGEPVHLTLFAPASNPDAYGFLPFTDATSGDITYGGGRYIDMELPEAGQTELEIDFNVAYNPLCAYVPHYNCPIPPAENALDVEIRAGEKAYHEGH